jgi:hypothetical protein
MNASPRTFLHILAFQCPLCEKPVVASVPSSMRSLEPVDSANLNLTCSCGWSDGRLGAQARQHLVMPWSAPDESSANDRERGNGEEHREEDTLNTL